MNNTPDTPGILREADPREELEAIREAYRSERQQHVELRKRVDQEKKEEAIAFAEWLSKINPIARQQVLSDLYEHFKTTTP